MTDMTGDKMKVKMNKYTENKCAKYKIFRGLLIFWMLFIGLGAVGGAACMFIDPSGKLLSLDFLLPCLQKLPFADVLFQNFIFAGVALLVGNGLTNLTAAVLLLRRKKAGLVCGGIFGITLMLWICVQFCIFPLNYMSTLYFVFGLAQALTAFLALKNSSAADFAHSR